MRRSLRALSLVMAGVMVGGLLLTPVSAHITQNGRHVGVHAWTEHIRTLVFTRTQMLNIFYPRAAADALFQRKCQDGAVLAYATVDADAGFSGDFTTDGVTAFNCTGGAVEVMRIVQGTQTYHVRFTGLEALDGTTSNAQVTAVQNTAAFGTVNDDGTPPDNSFTVKMWDAAGGALDADFSLTIFRAG